MQKLLLFLPTIPVVLYTFWTPQPSALVGRVATSNGSCSSEMLTARETDHSLGVSVREAMIKKWAPRGSVKEWDSEFPMDTASAWNAPTVWDVWAPTYGCVRPVHIGGVAGSKWGTSLPLENKVVCNAHLLKTAKPCVVYSFGVGWDTTFEQAVLRIAPDCTVRVFDPTMEPSKFYSLVAQQALDGESPPSPPRLNFYQVGLAAESTDNYSEGMLWNNVQSIKVKTLEGLMKGLGDDHLTILKVDIEGSEWTALHQTVSSGAMEKVDQLLLEVHMAGCEKGYKENNRGKLHSMFHALEGAGMRSFSQVPNLVPVSKGDMPGCSEYSFVNQQGLFAKNGCGM